MLRNIFKSAMERWLKSDGSRIAMGVALVAAGVFAGAALPPSGAALAQLPPGAQPQHFQSGGQLSVPVLKEIAATLRQMDARLARIETAAQQFRPARGNQATGK
jgi:hypothetical protein